MSRHLFRLAGVFTFTLGGALAMTPSVGAQIRGSIGQVVPSTPNFYAPPAGSFGYPAATFFISQRPMKIGISYPESFSTPSGITGGLYDVGLGGRRSYYAPTDTGAVPPAAPTEGIAEIDVRLPASADLWFEGVRTTQSGTYRQFLSPPLSIGRDYAYQVRAMWKEGDREVARTRRVRVRAGDRVDVDFLAPATTREAAVPIKTNP